MNHELFGRGIRSRMESSDGTSHELEVEENDMLLYLWQRAAFMDTGQGIPREISDSLRLRIAQLSSYHTKLRKAGKDSWGTGMVMRDHLHQYARVMDERDEGKGMNNLFGAVDALLAGRVKASGCKNWTSCLDIDTIKAMPEFQALEEEAETYAKDLERDDRSIPLYPRHLPLHPGSPSSSTCSTTPSSSIMTSTTSSISSSAIVAHPNTKTHPRLASLPLPSHTAGVTTTADWEGTCSTTKIHNSRDSRFQYPNSLSEASPLTSKDRGSWTGSKSRNFNVGDRRSQRGCHSKRARVEEEEEEEGMADMQGEVGGKTSAFSSAKDEYVRQQRRRFGGGREGGKAGMGPLIVNDYGSTKKSLGTRKGASRFVPPVRKDEDNNCRSGGYVQSRDVTGGRGGGERSYCLPPELEGDERLKNIEPRMVELIMNEIVDHGAPVQWEDIAGLEFAKATINEIIVWPMMRPDLFTGLRGPPKGVLLFGPPGTGKTLIGRCIASQVAATFFSISASSLTSKWIGEGEKMVRAMFAVARCFQPAVIFMDEIDALLSQRSDTEHESSRRIKTEFLVQLDGATTSDTDRLLVIGATNRPQEIDEAARRRLVKRLYIPLPDTSARRQIVLNLLKQQPFCLDDQELEQIGRDTTGYSGSDMANLCREAAYGPVREAASSILHISVDQIREVQYKDFESALKVIKPSVSEKDLELYINWNKQFGCGR